LFSCLLLQGFHLAEETTEGSFVVDKARWFYAPHPMTFMLSVSIVVTDYPAVILLASTEVKEDQVVFHHRTGVVHIELFPDDAIASGFAPYLIDLVNSFAGSYSLSHFKHITGVSLNDIPVSHTPGSFVDGSFVQTELTLSRIREI
jgi:hypothetical protein